MSDFVWKPIGDNTRRAVAVLPSGLSGRTQRVELIDSKGNVVEVAKFRSFGNGNRGNWDFRQQGPAYRGLTLRVVTDDNKEIFQNVGAGTRLVKPQSAFLQGSKFEPSAGGGEAGGIGNVSDPNDPNYNPNISTSAGGQSFVTPGLVDYSTVPTPYVDYQANVDRARTEGAKNNELFYQNLDKSKDPALGLVDTDIAGIQKGLDAFIPQIRQQGDIDQQTNIDRAGKIDAANMSRIPGLNEFNRGQVAENNKFNQTERDKAIDSSGLDYRGRIGGLLDSLTERAKTGRLSGDLDKSLSTDLANRGSDLGRSSGISSLSRAGVRANDRLTVSERVNLALGAEAALPGVLQTGQNTLQSQPERAPTLFGEPQPIPLNQSNIADKIPVQSSISAGAAQQALNSEVNQYELLPATGILSTGLSTDQFNESAATNTALAVLDRQQNQLNAVDSAVQGGINSDTAADLRAQQNEAFQQGNQVLQDSQTAAGIGQIGGLIQAGASLISAGNSAGTTDGNIQPGGSASTNSGGGQYSGSGAPGGEVVDGNIIRSSDGTPIGTSINATGASPGVSSVAPSASDGINIGPSQPQVGSSPSFTNDGVGYSTPVSDGGATSAPTAFDPGGSSTSFDVPATSGGNGYSTPTGFKSSPPPQAFKMGNTTVSPQNFDGLQQGIQEFNSSSQSALAITKKRSLEKPVDDQAVGATTKGAGVAPMNSQEVLDELQGTKPSDKPAKEPDLVEEITKPLSDAGLDLQNVTNTASAIENWDKLTPVQQTQAVSGLGLSVLENKGIIPSEEAKDIRGANNALTVLMDPNSSDVNRAAAVVGAGAGFATTSFTGDINQPRTIGGNAVVGSTTSTDGKPAFMVSQPDGSTSVVTQAELINGSNTLSGIQAFSVLTSKAPTEQKLTALTGIGIQTAAANDIISQVNAGNVSAALGIFNLATNFDDMNYVQKGVAIMQTGQAVMQSTYGSAIASGVREVGSNIASALFGEATATATSTATSTGTSTAAAAGQSAATTVGTEVSAIATGLGYVAAVYSIYSGVSGALDMHEMAGDVNSSQTGNLVASGAASGASIGTGVGSVFGPVGAAVGFVIGAAIGSVAGTISGLTTTGKSGAQMASDRWRSGLEAAGFAEKNKETNTHEVTLADGTKYNIGLDGNGMLKNKGVNLDGATERRTKDVDWSNPVAVEAIPEANLMAAITGLDPTSNSGFDAYHNATAQMLNAATSNANDIEGVRDNFRAMLKKTGIKPVEMAMRLDMLRVTNKISEQEYGIMLDRTNKLMGSNIVPPDRQKVTDALVAEFSKVPEDKRDDYTKQMLKNLTDPKAMAKSKAKLEKRIAEDLAQMDKTPGKQGKGEVSQETINRSKLPKGSRQTPETFTAADFTREGQPVGDTDIAGLALQNASSNQQETYNNGAPRRNPSNIRLKKDKLSNQSSINR